jgi:hypothetical protein
MAETHQKSLLRSYAEPPKSPNVDANSGGVSEYRAISVELATETRVAVAQFDPSNPWQPAAGLSILAVLDPPGPDGQPGQARFAPGLTLAERREIMLDDEFFQVRIRRRAAAAEVAEGENENQNETATTKGT